MQLRASVVTAAVAAALLLGSATVSAAQAASQLPQHAVPQMPKQADAVGPGGAVASDGVEATFREQVRENAARFAQFSSTSKLFLPGGQLPVVGSTFRNPQLAATYEQIGRQGVADFYGGPLGSDIVNTAEHLPLAPGATI